MASLFLSCARGENESFVERIYHDLVRRGFSVWWDRVAMPGRELMFLREIRDAINAHERLVLVLGPIAAAADYVIAEWRHAVTCGKPVSSILRLGDYSLVPDELKLFHTADFRDDARYGVQFESLVQQLSEPAEPMGRLLGVPALPPDLLTRPDRLKSLKNDLFAGLDRPVVLTSPADRVVVHGMGGIGKSVLANQLAREVEVRRAFPDGIVWVQLGQAPNLLELQRNVARAFADPGDFSDILHGRATLVDLLASKAVLLVLDDVFEPAHAQAFSAVQ